MKTAVANAALAALRWWIRAAQGHMDAAADTGLGEEQHTVRAAAWRVIGQPVPEQGWPTLPAGPLESIFNRVEPKRAGQPRPMVFLQRASLALKRDVLFPQPIEALGMVDSATDPIAALAADVARIDDQHELPIEARLEGLVYALQRHAWSLPSPLDGVSLYDFARTHAAVAAAQAADAAGGDTLFLLGGDLSGVQSFLYTLTAEGATKSLRGRSFYLQLLTEACARHLLRAAELPLTNLLYAGGGRFYLLLPNQIGSTPTTEWLAGQQKMFDTFFLQRHQGDLYLALGGDRLPVTSLLDTPTEKRFSAAWGLATEAINRAKRRRFAALDNLAQLFAPHGGGDESMACAVCDYRGQADEFTRNDDDDGDELQRCLLCDSFEKLGRMLHNAEYLVLRHLDRAAPGTHVAHLSLPRQPWNEILSELGTHVQIRGDHASFRERGNFDPSWPVRWTTILALDTEAAKRDDAQLIANFPIRMPFVRGLRPVANASPTYNIHTDDWNDWKEIEQAGEHEPRDGDVKTFSLMVAQSQGVKRLGVLRMDVDDLGDLFRFRLDGGLARVSALSAALALFFEGWVGVLCAERNDTPPERVYSIYSGGDDLFIVGSWDLLPQLARDISDDLAAYTGKHPDIHVSAGISLHSAKFPLYQAAEAADRELKRAKVRRNANEETIKAALGWLEQVVGWEHADALFSLANSLTDYTSAAEGERPQVSRALLQTLQVLYAQYAEGLDEHRLKVTGRYGTRKSNGADQTQIARKLFFGPWIWRGAYQLKRVAQQIRKDVPDYQAIQWLIDELREGLLDGADLPANTGGRAIERAGLAARWTELRIRKERD